PKRRAVLSHVPPAVHLAWRRRAGQVPSVGGHPCGDGPRLATALRLRDRSHRRGRPRSATLARATVGDRPDRPRRAPGARATLSASRDTEASGKLRLPRADAPVLALRLRHDRLRLDQLLRAGSDPGMARSYGLRGRAGA